MSSKRIYSFDVLKVLFAILIALSHFQIYVPGFDVAVEFFFILSGFFLANKFFSKKEKNQEQNSWEYTKDHIKKLYPHYIYSLVVMIVLLVLKNMLQFIDTQSFTTIKDMFLSLYNTIPEFLMLQNNGIYTGGINYPLWQISTLISAGYFIYELLTRDEKLTTKIICPLAILLAYTYLKGSNVEYFSIYGIIYIPLLRAFALMSLGVITYNIVKSEEYHYILEKHPLFLNIISIISLISLIIYQRYNFIHFILSIIIIMTLYYKDSWLNKILNKEIFKGFGDLSYAIYLNHAVIILVVNYANRIIQNNLNIYLSQSIVTLIYLIVLLIYSKITLKIVSKIKNKKAIQSGGN